ncbi:MAG: HAD hydrolase family protein [Patescibacteria group bacterium]|nr:HAD hydrolase family protein [Patescibacteria group bacterium]
MSETFPKPDSHFALIDLDGTLVDETYNQNSNDLIDTVTAAQSAGWTIGLSSDTPYEALKSWHEKFNMNGPILAERGAVVAINGVLEYSRHRAESYAVAREKIGEYFNKQSIKVWYGNPVEAITQKKSIAEPGEAVMMVSDQRLCSLGIFARRVTANGVIVVDNNLLESQIDSIRDCYPVDLDTSEDLNYDYGLVIATCRDVDKRTGTRSLLSKLRLGKIAMIGNSMADFLGHDVANHYSVGNADEEFKAVADYSDPLKYTLGVQSILKGLSGITAREQ